MGNCNDSEAKAPSRVQRPQKAASPVLEPGDVKKDTGLAGYAVDVSVQGRCDEWRKAVSAYTTLLKNKLNHDPRMDELKKEGRTNDLDPSTVLGHCHEGLRKESLTCHKHIDALSKSITPEMIAEGLWSSLRQQVGNNLLIELLEVTTMDAKQVKADIKNGTLLRPPSSYVPSDGGSLGGSYRNMNASIGCRSGSASGSDMNIADNLEDTKAAENEMLAAATRGDDDAISRLHDTGVSVMVKNNWSTTPLHCAATNGHLSTVELLFELGAEIECVAVGSTPLHLAAINGKAAVCESLLELGADLNAIAGDGLTPLHKAAMFGNSDTIALLIKCGADVHSTSKDGITPIHVASKSGNAMAIELLQSHGGDINCCTKSNLTPFHFAAKKGSRDSLRYLQKNGADIFAVDDAKSTALHYAARSGHAEACLLLLSLGLSANEPDKAGHTALHYAVKDGDRNVIAVIQSGTAPPARLKRSQSINFSNPPTSRSTSRRASVGHMKRAASLSCQNPSANAGLSTEALAKTYAKLPSPNSNGHHRNSVGGFGRRSSRNNLCGNQSRRGSLDSISNISRDGSAVGFSRRKSNFVER